MNGLNWTATQLWLALPNLLSANYGDIVYVEVETVGKHLEAGAVFGTVEAVKTVSDLFLPLSGTISELNPKLANAPELVNNDPYGDGWMIRMKLDNPSDLSSLLSAKDYQEMVD